MSRIGNEPVTIASGVTVTIEDNKVATKGPLGELSLALPKSITATVDGDVVTVSRPDDTRQSKSYHGLARTLVANMVEGVAKGFTKELQIEGVGFKAAVQGKNLSLSLGFASPIIFPIPDGITVKEEGGTRVVVSGPDKQQVGDIAARIRSFFPAEPYKGKGVRYVGEQVRRKVGKTVA